VSSLRLLRSLEGCLVFTVTGLAVMIAAGASQEGGTLILPMAVPLPMMLGSYLVSFINYRHQKREGKYNALLQRQRKIWSVCVTRRGQRLLDECRAFPYWLGQDRMID
jgi:hypothetical protein